jgi:hypothetical protein
VLAVVVSAQRSKVRPNQSQLRSISDRDDVIDLFGSATAADDATHRIEPNELGSELLPVCVVASVCRVGPPSVEHSLAFTLVGRRAGPAVGRGFHGHQRVFLCEPCGGLDRECGHFFGVAEQGFGRKEQDSLRACSLIERSVSRPSCGFRGVSKVRFRSGINRADAVEILVLVFGIIFPIILIIFFMALLVWS